MNLDKKSLQAIGEIVDDKIKNNNKVIDKKIKNNNEIVIDTLTKNFTKEFGLLRLEMNQRFDEADKKIDGVEIRLSDKIEEVKQMENEDILALSDDVVRIKKCVGIK